MDGVVPARPNSAGTSIDLPADGSDRKPAEPKNRERIKPNQDIRVRRRPIDNRSRLVIAMVKYEMLQIKPDKSVRIEFLTHEGLLDAFDDCRALLESPGINCLQVSLHREPSNVARRAGKCEVSDASCLLRPSSDDLRSVDDHQQEEIARIECNQILEQQIGLFTAPHAH